MSTHLSESNGRGTGAIYMKTSKIWPASTGTAVPEWMSHVFPGMLASFGIASCSVEPYITRLEGVHPDLLGGGKLGIDIFNNVYFTVISVLPLSNAVDAKVFICIIDDPKHPARFYPKWGWTWASMIRSVK